MAFAENPLYVGTVLCLMVVLSIYAAKTKIGKQLSAALLVILFTAVFANLKLIPSASNTIPLYEGIFAYLAPLSIFYLMLGVNLGSIKKAGAPMIILFLIGSLATVLGILIAWAIIAPQKLLGEDAHLIAGMLAGTYTGGSVNFNAVALEYGFQEKGILYAGTIAVDNVVTAVWIVATLTFPALLRKFWKDKKVGSGAQHRHAPEKETIDLRSLMWLLFLGLGALLVSEILADLVPAVPGILSLTTLGILLAQTRFVANLRGSHALGLYLVYIFLAVIGAYCEIGSVVELQQVGTTLLGFATLAVFLHGVILIALGSWIYRDWEMISIVSQANIGGAATAISMAEVFGRNELILPAILVGTLGSALGTYLGFMVVALL
ncbi:MAG: DUF819 family protein [Flavobacteriaceae bacterium]